MIFRRSKKRVSKSANGMDKLITGIVIGSAAAGIYGLSRSKKGKKVLKNAGKKGQSIFSKGLALFGKVAVKAVKIFEKK